MDFFRREQRRSYIRKRLKITEDERLVFTEEDEESEEEEKEEG